MTTPQIRIVLDTAALVAYAHLESPAVGELILMVEEDQGASLIGVPALAYLHAHRSLAADERARLVAMATNPDSVVVILPLLGDDTPTVAGIAAEVEDGLAHAVVETRRHGATLATYMGAAARRHLEEDDILDLE